MQTTHKYHFRKGHQSESYLVEFTSSASGKKIVEDILVALKGLKIRVKEGPEMWMNNETLISVQSLVGNFLISIDTWGLVWIMPTENKKMLTEIVIQLSKSPYFQSTGDHLSDSGAVN